MLGLEIGSLTTSAGELQIYLDEVGTPALGPGEALVRIEAAPINPSDLGLLFGRADLNSLRSDAESDRPRVTGSIPAAALPGLTARLDHPQPVGNEGAGTVVEAASDVQDWVGRTVALLADVGT